MRPGDEFSGTTSEVDEAPETLEQIPITKVVFGEEELRAVQLPVESGWVVQGPYVAQFEQTFAEYVGAAHAAAASSCTTALHLAVCALGLDRGVEVVVPAFTWVSTANVVEYTGAKPVFCDIDLQTFNADPAAVEAAISERTAGLLPVHLFGLCADMDGILATARTARPLGRRGCRLRLRRLDRRPTCRNVRRPRLFQLSPAEVDHDRRGRHGHHTK